MLKLLMRTALPICAASLTCFPVQAQSAAELEAYLEKLQAEKREKYKGEYQSKETRAAELAASGNPANIAAAADFYLRSDNRTGYDANPDKAMVYYRRCALLDYAYCQMRMGDLLSQRRSGIQNDYPSALLWYGKAAKQNLAGAHVGLAVLHANGSGVERDHAKSFKYYQSGAKLGSPSGLNGMAVQYDRGQGVEQAPSKALAFYTVAEERGHRGARRGVRRSKNKGVTVTDEALANVRATYPAKPKK